MKPEIKKKWVAALRSGDYKQGRTYLENDGKFCCLGVLCSLAVDEGIAERSEIIDLYTGKATGVATYNARVSMLPREIKNWAGQFDVPALIEMNDEKRNKFKTIANYIEKNF